MYILEEYAVWVGVVFFIGAALFAGYIAFLAVKDLYRELADWTAKAFFRVHLGAGQEISARPSLPFRHTGQRKWIGVIGRHRPSPTCRYSGIIERLTHRIPKTANQEHRSWKV